MDSTITFVGNLARDPELKFTQSGQAVVGFGVAVNRRWQKDGEWVEQVSFIDVTAWGTLAENISESLEKGARVLVFGRIEQESWEQDDGQKRSKLKVVADSVGPDLRWATVSIQKNERTEGAGSGQQKQAAKPKAAAKPAANPYDEEPF